MITIERAKQLVAHYQGMQGLDDWEFDVSIVPGLKFNGGDAWAVVEPNVKTKRASVQIRDTDKTPIPGFDGDPVIELKLTISHELWHCWTAPIFGNTTSEAAIAYEEKLVEAAARAVVMSEGTNDARVMARSVQAVPLHIRARIATISALATRQRIAGRKHVMNPKMIEQIIAAIKDGNGEAAIELLTQLLANAAGSMGGDGAASSREGAPDVPEKPKDGEVPMVARYGETPEMAKARKAIDASVASADRSARVSAQIATRARIKELRADGVAIDEASASALEKLGDIDAVEERIGWMLKGRETGTQRARSGVLPDESKDKTAGVSAEALTKEGFDSSFVGMYQTMHAQNKESADEMLEAARRARVAPPVPWTVSKNGSAQ